MQEAPHGAAAGVKQRSAEIGVGLFTLLLGAIVIYGSSKVGIGWGSDGPEAGFFPFYVGLFIAVCSLINLFSALREDPDAICSEWSQIRQVLKVLIPTAIYCLLVEPLGIYVPSIILIAVFMKWLGHYRWPITAAIAIGVPAAFYFVFEKWFLIPLPKGPVEALLGL
ncbi:tripartite tricarboxylate transporter TctB family protein [Ancylobacter sp. 6x-1]|uniref:Tripartite tricarboxylate transporter TctB family protein n=1 Tax=Ancylobacter crimeensis TaxID=2579147 RepID=A0ABT0DCC2_9HYPH|nr:tripartite tricarboxylate transporter TctB family protein [Ancylobacter crimeensis]MCK0197544.1 tripartite tricarboxylate transporter TctB family protein [Ancylobacter crimeensis]